MTDMPRADMGLEDQIKPEPWDSQAPTERESTPEWAELPDSDEGDEALDKFEQDMRELFMTMVPGLAEAGHTLSPDCPACKASEQNEKSDDGFTPAPYFTADELKLINSTLKENAAAGLMALMETQDKAQRLSISMELVSLSEVGMKLEAAERAMRAGKSTGLHLAEF